MAVWTVTMVNRDRRGRLRRRCVARLDGLLHGGSAPWRWLDYQAMPAESGHA